jgi:hypothetical protein
VLALKAMVSPTRARPSDANGQPPRENEDGRDQHRQKRAQAGAPVSSADCWIIEATKALDILFLTVGQWVKRHAT